MTILVDACLSPGWVPYLESGGFPAIHWSYLGPTQAPDAVIFDIARQRGATILTHDLDFGTILALSGATGPSVVQARLQDISVTSAGPLVLQSLRQFQKALSQGCILTILPGRQRVRILPLQPPLGVSMPRPTTP